MRSFLLSSLFCCYLSICFGQDWSGKTYEFNKIYPGYMVSNEGDTTTGYVEHNGRTYNQKNCIFYSDASKKDKKKLGPDDIKAWGVGDKNYRSIHFTGGLNSKPLGFVLCVKPGRISEFVYYSKKDGVSDMMGKNETYADYDARVNQDEIVWQKLDEKPIQHNEFILGFAKKVSRMTEDYPELSEKVASKEKGYGLGSVFSVMDEYNAWWDKKNKK